MVPFSRTYTASPKESFFLGLNAANRKSKSQRFSFARANSQGNSAVRARFSLGIEFADWNRNHQRWKLATSNRNVSLFRSVPENRSDFGALSSWAWPWLDELWQTQVMASPCLGTNSINVSAASPRALRNRAIVRPILPVLILRNARPATGIETPNPETPRKKLKNYLPGPVPELQKKIRSRPGKPNQRKGQNEKFMNFAHFFVNSGVFPLENKHDSHLFRNAPAKSSWTDLSLVWFAGATPEKIPKYWKYPKNTSLGVFLVFLFSLRIWGRCPGDNFLFFLRNFGAQGFSIPVAGQAFLNSYSEMLWLCQ